jgi:hypothetical protein
MADFGLLRTRSSRCWRWALVACALLHPAIARAAPPQTRGSTTTKGVAPADDATKEAIARFKRGLELYKEGAYATALIEFRKAYELSPNWRVLYNIGLVCSEMQDAVCAVRSLQGYLAQGTDIPANRRSEVEREIAKMKPRTAMLVVETNTDGVDVAIDDVPAGKTPNAQGTMVNSGRRKIYLAKTGYLPVERIVDVPGADTTHVKVDMLQQQVDAPREAPREAPSEAKPRMTTASWIGIGVAGALAVASVTTGVIAWTKWNSYKDTAYPDLGSAQSAQNTFRAFSITADVTGAAAIVAAGVTLGLTFLLPQSEAARPSVTLGVSPTGASLHGRF